MIDILFFFYSIRVTCCFRFVIIKRKKKYAIPSIPSIFLLPSIRFPLSLLLILRSLHSCASEGITNRRRMIDPRSLPYLSYARRKCLIIYAHACLRLCRVSLCMYTCMYNIYIYVCTCVCVRARATEKRIDTYHI